MARCHSTRSRAGTPNARAAVAAVVSQERRTNNEGNSILEFGTYGNRDSMGGLEGDLVPTKDIPMAFPNSVDATDDYIYVSDMVNLRLIRLGKTFILDASVKM